MIKKVLVLLLLVMGSSNVLVLAVETKTYKIDGSHSNVGFTARHMISKVNGEFAEFDGKFSFNAEDLSASRLTATVQAASISTRDQKRDDHLRSEDFFGVKKFPTLHFVSKQLVEVSPKKYKMIGDLTMRGVTKLVTFDVEYLGEVDDPWGGHRAGFMAKTKVNRKEFGIIWNKTLDNGGLLVGDEVEISVNVEGLEDKASKASKMI